MTENREQSELLSLISSAPAGTRVFCIGIGNEVNRPLLRQLAEGAGGLVGMLGKIVLEMNSGANIFVSDTSFIPISLSHFIGAIIGAIIGLAIASSDSYVDFAESFVIRRCRS